MKTLGLIAQEVRHRGKTTLATHLGVQALTEGLQVVLIDADLQASASAWWQRRSAETRTLVQGSGDEVPRILEPDSGVTPPRQRAAMTRRCASLSGTRDAPRFP